MDAEAVFVPRTPERNGRRYKLCCGFRGQGENIRIMTIDNDSPAGGLPALRFVRQLTDSHSGKAREGRIFLM